MKITLIAVGQKLPTWAQTACDDYAKRLKGSAFDLNIKLVKAEDRGNKPVDTVMLLERQRIEAALPSGATLIALDERGKDMTTQALAQTLQAAANESQHLALIIGGADGLAPELKSQADALWRLSSMTLPHAMARVLLIEQIYRAWTALNNHPYNRV